MPHNPVTPTSQTFFPRVHNQYRAVAIILGSLILAALIVNFVPSYDLWALAAVPLFFAILYGVNLWRAAGASATRFTVTLAGVEIFEGRDAEGAYIGLRLSRFHSERDVPEAATIDINSSAAALVSAWRTYAAQGWRLQYPTETIPQTPEGFLQHNGGRAALIFRQ